LYEIIGEGAYGKVYRATNKNDTKEYAVKVIEVRRFK
jgi:serine/threonine protein kinase